AGDRAVDLVRWSVRGDEREAIEVPLDGGGDEALLLAVGGTELVEVDLVVAEDDLGIDGLLADAAEALRHRVVDVIARLARRRCERRGGHESAPIVARGAGGSPASSEQASRLHHGERAAATIPSVANRRSLRP